MDSIILLRAMTPEDAAQIAAWRYEPPFDVYNAENTPAGRDSFLDGLHFTAWIGSERIGFVALGPAAALPLEALREIYEDESYTDLALGLRPDLLGTGMGGSLLDTAMRLAARLFPGDGWRVTVATDHVRALHIYKSRRFREICSFKTEILYPDASDTVRCAPKAMRIMIREADTDIDA